MSLVLANEQDLCLIVDIFMKPIGSNFYPRGKVRQWLTSVFLVEEVV